MQQLVDQSQWDRLKEAGVFREGSIPKTIGELIEWIDGQGFELTIERMTKAWYVGCGMLNRDTELLEALVQLCLKIREEK